MFQFNAINAAIGAKEAAVAGVAYGAYSLAPMDALYVAGGTALGSMVGGNAPDSNARYMRTAIIGAGAAGGAYLAGKRTAMDLGVAVAAGIVGHAAVQTYMFPEYPTLGPITL